MLFGIPAQFIVQGGAVGLLLVVAVLIFMGRLVPWYLVKQMRADLLPWRETAEMAIAVNRENTDQISRLVQTQERLIRAQEETEAVVRTAVTAITAAANVRKDAG